MTKTINESKISDDQRFYIVAALVLMIVGSIASLSLYNGFSGDQALFTIYSKALSGGAVLYRDVWDIKQPGIFVFYLLAGKSFGFTETGIHLFEMLYWFGFSLMLVFGLKNYFTNPLYSTLTPLFTIGIYYSVSGSIHLTQVEALVCFPLFLSLWFCQKYLENPEKKIYLFLSGLCGGIILMLKLMFALILVMFWFYLFLFYKNDFKRMAVSVVLILPGILIPTTAVILYFVSYDALADLWYTTFVYPAAAVMSVLNMKNRNEVLINGLLWFFRSYFPVIMLTLVLLLINLKSFLGRWYRNENLFYLQRGNFIFSGLFLWLFAGFTVILMQKLSWWEYHYSLLMTPLGILAIKCLEKIVEILKSTLLFRQKNLAFAALVLITLLLFIPTVRRLGNKIRQANEAEIVEIGNRQAKISGDALGDYRSMSGAVAFLKNENPKASMFVFANPLYYYLSDTPPPIASNGAMIDMFTTFEWNRLNREITEKTPDYIYIETVLIPLIEKEDPAFVNDVNNSYSPYRNGDRGLFYKLNE